ncbi:hypothetical protein LZZ90_04350 [Flavobacterium sp. SM15]|uniref:hypothetical protein n=1 Tax=Flavobacterium sp. SM15 TaxID=2908005 RepID=UPI001EDBB079|nr:hypothetical protein [Flavobacterium sp. SM15]MCG2610733.1 hypothetical protein [Flavobacterium sp. SM15]
MKIRLFLFLYLIGFIAFGQNVKVLKGKVVAPIKNLSGINIRNLSTQKETVSVSDGEFSILVKAGDSLVFTSVQLESKQIVIEKEDFDYLPFLVKMKAKVTQLNELIIKESKVDAVSLGIIKKKIKKLTPAERRLYAATSGPLDILLNAFSGRTSQLKKGVEIEKYQITQNKVFNMFDKEYFTEEYKIPEEYIDGFVVYASEKPKIMDAVKQKNKLLTAFLLGELAEEYKKMIAEKK